MQTEFHSTPATVINAMAKRHDSCLEMKSAKMKTRCINRFGSICGKYGLSELGVELLSMAILFWRMDCYEFLCDKYNMSEVDRNRLASSLIMALQIRRSIPMVQNKNSAMRNKQHDDPSRQSNGLCKIA